MTVLRADQPDHDPTTHYRPHRCIVRRLSGVAIALGFLAAAAAAAATVSGSPAWSPASSATAATVVDLSPSTPGAIRHADGSWTVLVPPSARRPVEPGAIARPIVCSGNYVDPEITVRRGGTAVHYGVKFFCTDPVSYSIRLGVDNYYDTDPGPGGKVLRHTGGPEVSRGGVSANPFAEGFSTPCVGNDNSGWQVWDDASLGDNQKHRDRGKRVTVGCRVS